MARHRAERFAGRGPVLDVGCSVGGDLLALAAVAGPVTGVDRDEARLLLAAENARVLDLPVQLVAAQAADLRPHGWVFADPARRSGGRRVHDPRRYAPPLDLLGGWLPGVAGMAVKVAPGLDHDALPPDWEVELVSLGGEVKEAVLWGGDLRRGAGRTATVLPAGATLVGRDAQAATGPPGRFLLEPDGAVVRAHLVAELAEQVQGRLLDPTIAYLTADTVTATAFGAWYEVLELLPFGLKPLRERLRAYDAGPPVVKKRGTAVEPDELRRRLRLTGPAVLTVVLTRAAGRQVALICRPVSGVAAGPAPG